MDRRAPDVGPTAPFIVADEKVLVVLLKAKADVQLRQVGSGEVDKAARGLEGVQQVPRGAAQGRLGVIAAEAAQCASRIGVHLRALVGRKGGRDDCIGHRVQLAAAWFVHGKRLDGGHAHCVVGIVVADARHNSLARFLHLGIGHVHAPDGADGRHLHLGTQRARHVRQNHLDGRGCAGVANGVDSQHGVVVCLGLGELRHEVVDRHVGARCAAGHG